MHSIVFGLNIIINIVDLLVAGGKDADETNATNTQNVAM